MPMWEQVQLPVLMAGRAVVSWQGVRADESRARALLPRWQRMMPAYKSKVPEGAAPSKWRSYAYRPLLEWKIEDVWTMHDKHGVPRNRLYDQGMSRVGCMPCIMAKKMELREIAQRFPEHIDRIEEWERLVMDVSKKGLATFFTAPGDPLLGDGVSVETAKEAGHGVRTMVEWSKTSRGGKQYDLELLAEFGTACNQWGACE
jgi:3'-phosphoadenosine 5'-phosphosulfate sulfotransferase (PAPS reductase)/FAD synthetase